MPNLDGTGPMGKGAMTGKGTGNCQQKFAARTRQIQHETGEPHTDSHKLPAQAGNDVFVRRNQNK